MSAALARPVSSRQAASPGRPPPLRFITCGSVDDGKSTLLGRLLHDTGQIPSDQLAKLEVDSRRVGTRGDALDFALLADGLLAEREQGITIDVAYRYFATPNRSFIAADTPGHAQYTRNMATGASTADLALVLVDARKGILEQTRRHSYVVALMGVGAVLLLVNKMDLIAYGEAEYAAIVAEYARFAGTIGLHQVQAIPISAPHGDNIASQSARTPWYTGPHLVACLERAGGRPHYRDDPFRMPVQWVNRPDPDFRGFSGRVASGMVRPGAEVLILPSGRASRIDRIVTQDGDLDAAEAGDAVTLVLADEIDCARGDIIAASRDAIAEVDQFEATLVWMSGQEMIPGRSYWLKIGCKEAAVTVTEIQHSININTLEHLAAKTLALNEIAVCNLGLDQPLPFTSYAVNRELGGFILIDRITHETLAAGMIRGPLQRAQNIQFQPYDVDKAARAAAKQQKPAILWFTGLSAAGKSTIANLVERMLYERRCHTYLLDGDNVRKGLNRDLGFADVDRVENVRRIAEVSRMMVEAGLIVLVAVISPFRADRAFARGLVPDGEFVEIHVDAPFAVLEARDPKKLYQKSRNGRIVDMTGIGSAYEQPEQPDLYFDTSRTSAEDAAATIVRRLVERGIVR